MTSGSSFLDYTSRRRGASPAAMYNRETFFPPISSRSFSPVHYPATIHKKNLCYDNYPISHASSNSSISSLYSEKLPPRVPQEKRTHKRTYTQNMFDNKLKILEGSDQNRSLSIEPRRVYPQTSSNHNLSDLEDGDDSSIVLDANLSFIFGCKSRLRQNIKPVPAYQAEGTSNNELSNKIKNFLRRTDHVMDEWQRVGKRRKSKIRKREQEEEKERLNKSRSERNIMIKSLQMYSRSSVARSLPRINSDETLTEGGCGEGTYAEVDEISEITGDLPEDPTTSSRASDRLEADNHKSDRHQNELSAIQSRRKYSNSLCSDMEVSQSKSHLNGFPEEVDEVESSGIYKQRYETLCRELEFTKKKLRQQHEDDLEQLIGLKKQLEKKLNNAYEEVEEQKQVVGQFKNKLQKLTGEMNDLKHLLEQQNSRNNFLERKQRKLELELQKLQDELKKEKNAKERTVREKDVLMVEKTNLESALADTRFELNIRGEKINALQKEYDEVTCGESTGEEISHLRRHKVEMERRLHTQEEELYDLLSQVQFLEQAKLRLELTMESMQKEAKRETLIREDEMEEMRGNAQKKVKALEAQLETEHEQRTLLLRQKHELERRLADAEESEIHGREKDEALIETLNDELKEMKALVTDYQAQLEMQKAEAPNRNAIRQLRNQLEDAESAKALAVKAKQSMESDLSELEAQLDEYNRSCRESDKKLTVLSRENSELHTQLEENEEELAELMIKYKAATQQMSTEQKSLHEQISLVHELETERNQLREDLAKLTFKLESVDDSMAERSDSKVEELQSKLELEISSRITLGNQMILLKESSEKLQAEIATLKEKEQQDQSLIKCLQRSLRETKGELNDSISKELDISKKNGDLEKKLENLEGEAASQRNDLRWAKKRIADLQLALLEELGRQNVSESP